jgi:hypothetical protein
MATYTVHKSIIQVLGRIWLPPVVCAMDIELGEYEIGNMITLDREGVLNYLYTHCGDFQEIIDFRADLYNHYDKANVVIEWESPESEYTYNDCMYPSEEE